MTKAQEKKLLDQIGELQDEVKALRKELAERTVTVPVPYPVYVGYPYYAPPRPWISPFTCTGTSTGTSGGSLDNYTITVGPIGGDATGFVPSVLQ